MLRALENLATDPKDLTARNEAAYGALVSGIALANSGLGAVHGFASGLGGMFDIPHGLICASCLIPVLEMNADVIQRDIGELAASVEDAAVEDPLEWLIDTIGRLMVSFRLQDAIKEYNVPVETIPEIAKRSTGSSMSGNPKELSQGEKEQILSRVL
jgi:alcohol dehydrogenase class IV